MGQICLLQGAAAASRLLQVQKPGRDNRVQRLCILCMLEKGKVQSCRGVARVDKR